MTGLAVAAGLLIGLSLGALGGGGSILTVPALVYLLGQSPHQATGASLLVVGIAAVVGAIAHARAGRVAVKAGAAFGVLGVAGSYLGSRLSAAVPANVLLAGFGLLMVAAATAMTVRQLRGRRPRSSVAEAAAPARSRVPALAGTPATARAAPAGSAPADASAGTGLGPAAAERGPGASRRGPLAQAALVLGSATAVGLITGFFGVGGGFAVVPVLVLVLGFDMPTAAGTSLLVIAINSAAALASRAGQAMLTLDWPMVGAFTAAAMVGALAGGKLAGRARPERLAVAFTALIFAVAAYTLARSLPGLI